MPDTVAMPRAAGRPVLAMLRATSMQAPAAHCAVAPVMQPRGVPVPARRAGSTSSRVLSSDKYRLAARICPSSPWPIQLRRRAGRQQAQRARPSFRARRQMPRIIDGTGSISKGFSAIHYIENRNNEEIVFRNAQEPWRGRAVDLRAGRTRGCRPMGARGFSGIALPAPLGAFRCGACDACYRFARGKTAVPLDAVLTTATASTRSTTKVPRTAASNRGCPCARNATREPA